jgi:hypothetical protein
MLSSMTARRRLRSLNRAFPLAGISCAHTRVSAWISMTVALRRPIRLKRALDLDACRQNETKQTDFHPVDLDARLRLSLFFLSFSPSPSFASRPFSRSLLTLVTLLRPPSSCALPSPSPPSPSSPAPPLPSLATVASPAPSSTVTTPSPRVRYTQSSSCTRNTLFRRPPSPNIPHTNASLTRVSSLADPTQCTATNLVAPGAGDGSGTPLLLRARPFSS